MRIILLFILSCGVSFGADCRFYFADQSNWDGKLGFVFNLETTSIGTAPCTASSLKLVLGLADGTNWRWLVHQRNWELGRAYAVRAVIRPTGAELYVDGSWSPRARAAFAASSGNLVINQVPDWASGTTAYYPMMDDLKVENGADLQPVPDRGLRSAHVKSCAWLAGSPSARAFHRSSEPADPVHLLHSSAAARPPAGLAVDRPLRSGTLFTLDRQGPRRRGSDSRRPGGARLAAEDGSAAGP